MDALDDASTELMMTSGSDAILLLTGEAFLETSEEDATEYCESMVEKLQKQHDALQQEADTIVEEQNKLKVVLYARFGKSIHLEDDDDQGDK